MLIGVVESITATFYGPSWAPAVAFGFLLLTLAVRPAGILGRWRCAGTPHTAPLPRCGRGAWRYAKAGMGTGKFWGISFIVAVAFLLLTRGLIANEYYFFAAYQVLQYIVLATAWNILGRLHRLHQFRHRRVFRRRGLQCRRAAQAHLAAAAGDDPGRRHYVRHCRLRHRLSDPAAERACFSRSPRWHWRSSCRP